MSEQNNGDLLQALCTILAAGDSGPLGVYLKYDMSANLKRQASKLEGWEAEAERECGRLISTKRVKAMGILPKLQSLVEEGESVEALANETIKAAAGAIGAIVAKQVFKGNYGALITISEGLANLEAGQEFKPQAGREKSNRPALVELALRQLQSRGIKEPSQDELIAHLASAGVHISKGQMSKIVDELGLKNPASDARKGTSQARKRKQGKG
jgi:hypothetical protein